MVPEHHDLVRCIRRAVLPVINANARCARGVVPRHVEDGASWRKDGGAFALLADGPGVGFDVGVRGEGTGVEPCSAAAGSAGERVEHGQCVPRTARGDGRSSLGDLC